VLMRSSSTLLRTMWWPSRPTTGTLQRHPVSSW
jgi:hypothetical protein